MKPQFGVCKNKVGCSFAYTGEKVPVPPDLKCPECGQPLVIESAKPGGSKTLMVVGVVVLVALAGCVLALFAFKDQILGLVFQKSNTGPGVVQTQENTSTGSASVIQEPQETPANSPNSAVTPGPQTLASATQTPSPPTTPAPVVAAPAPQASPSVEQTTENLAATPAASPAAEAIQPEQATPSPPPAVANSDASSGTGAQVQVPATLTKTEVDATREDVLKRINAMPKFTDADKKRLTEKMETARSMERLFVVRFDTGQTNLSRAAVDQLVKRIKSKDVQDKISDPTVVFVVAGYADSAGDPKTNLAISQERADNVTKALRDKTNLLNVIHSVGMGSTDLLDGKRQDQNRAVEVWAVAP
jgi:outer membrane protein OmpA-like peptidoglycan-associated protein